MNTLEYLHSQIPKIESKLAYTFKDPSLLQLAFVHSSYINENHSTLLHNERLEFLGDSILNALISDYLYRILPSQPEGELSFLRSRLVSSDSCYRYIEQLNIESSLLLGKGERMNNRGRGRESILANLFEAIIGALYLDGGIAIVEKFLFNHFSKHFEEIVKTPLHNWKAQLQDYCQKYYQQSPHYQVIHESGPDHDKQFEISVFMGQKELGRGRGASKKEAQQAAAEAALSQLETL
jgi:ribonuclease III